MLTSSQPRSVVLAEARPSRKGQDSSTERHTPEGSRWITVHPNGDDGHGQPVLISGSGQVLAGMGGKFNGSHIGDVAGWKQAGTAKPDTYGVGGTHEGYNKHLATYGGAKAIADVTVHGQPVKHAGGTFSVHVAGGRGVEKTLNQHGQAQTAGGAFLEKHPNGGVIYHGGMGAPDTWHDFARHMSEDLLTHSAEHEHRRMMGRADTGPYKDEHEAEGHAYRKAAMKQVRDYIRAEGGIRAGRTRTVGQELRGQTARSGDEYRHQLPSWAKNANGKHTTDQMARLVGDTFPHLGIETEDDLREYLMGHERQRKADAAAEAKARAAKTAAPTSKQDPSAALVAEGHKSSRSYPPFLRDHAARLEQAADAGHPQAAHLRTAAAQLRADADATSVSDLDRMIAEREKEKDESEKTLAASSLRAQQNGGLTAERAAGGMAHLRSINDQAIKALRDERAAKTATATPAAPEQKAETPAATPTTFKGHDLTSADHREELLTHLNNAVGKGDDSAVDAAATHVYGLDNGASPEKVAAAHKVLSAVDRHIPDKAAHDPETAEPADEQQRIQDQVRHAPGEETPHEKRQRLAAVAPEHRAAYAKIRAQLARGTGLEAHAALATTLQRQYNAEDKKWDEVTQDHFDKLITAENAVRKAHGHGGAKPGTPDEINAAHHAYAAAAAPVSHLIDQAAAKGEEAAEQSRQDEIERQAERAQRAKTGNRPTWDSAPRGEEGDYQNGHLRFNRESWQTFAVDHPASIAEYNRLHAEGKRDDPYDPRVHHVIQPLTGSSGDHPVAAPVLAPKGTVSEQSKYIKRGSYSPEQQAAVDHLNAQKVKPPAADAVPLFADLAVKDRAKPSEKEKKRQEGGLLAGLLEAAMPTPLHEAVDLSPVDDDEDTADDTDETLDPLGQVGAHLEKDEHHPDRLTLKRHHTRGRDGKYNGSEVQLHKGDGPRTGARMSESVALSEAGTDRARREVLLQIISPGFGSSRDPKSGLPVYYTAQALQEAAPLFARKKCYLNHSTPAERKSRPEGDITRWGATVKEAWWDAGRQALVGRTRVVNSNLWEAIELDPDEVAVSIHAHGNGRTGTAEGKNAWLVESIDAVHSVDFVTYAGARGGVIQVLETDRAAVRFTETEQREAERDMFEDITERDLRDSRPDLVEAIIAGQKPAAVDLTEALRPYEERVHLLECELNRRDARSLVEKALAACGLPAPAAERLRVQFSEATYGLDGSPYASDAALVEAVGTAGKAEAEYIKSVTTPARAITGMGASAPATVPTTPSRPAPDRAVLSEAQRKMDNLLATRPTKGPHPAQDAATGATLQSRMDALVGAGTKG